MILANFLAGWKKLNSYYFFASIITNIINPKKRGHIFIICAIKSKSIILFFFIRGLTVKPHVCIKS